jgi:hypothetical protein
MSVVAASERLSAAFAGRDLGAALACFVPGDDIGYAGSEQSEQATGRVVSGRSRPPVFDPEVNRRIAVGAGKR